MQKNDSCMLKSEIDPENLIRGTIFSVRREKSATQVYNNLLRDFYLQYI
jgi:hypothetical protein